MPLCNPGSVIYNTVYVNGTWTVCDKCYDLDRGDLWNVKILTESIKILKTGPESAQVGTTITFTFNVWNDGEVALENVYVYDPLFEKYRCTAWFYLAMTRTRRTTSWRSVSTGCSLFSSTIPADYLMGASCGELNNYACAHGSYNGVSTTWGDGWAVYVYDPACQPVPV